ncbi:MAG: hypothetical protein KAG43_07585 [Candidatus Marithrix sp.]|nr:hypothetical protein [Candidatus Marithrix sp.]
MLGYIFIGIYGFVLMGIPVLVLIAFIYGLMKVNTEMKREANAMQQDKEVGKISLQDYNELYKVIAGLNVNGFLPKKERYN